jgi:non-ribosomal peptide synthetase component F
VPAHRAFTVCLDRDREKIASCPEDNPGRSAEAGGLAYVIYTSGSSSRPKGVMIEHRGIVNTITAQMKGFEVSSRERGLQLASPCFDASVSEISMALLAGSRLVLLPSGWNTDIQALTRYIKNKGVSIATSPPSLLNSLSPEGIASLKTTITASESANRDDVVCTAASRRIFNGHSFDPARAS